MFTIVIEFIKLLDLEYVVASHHDEMLYLALYMKLSPSWGIRSLKDNQ